MINNIYDVPVFSLFAPGTLEHHPWQESAAAAQVVCGTVIVTPTRSMIDGLRMFKNNLRYDRCGPKDISDIRLNHPENNAHMAIFSYNAAEGTQDRHFNPPGPEVG